MTDDILAAFPWKNNGELIAAVAKLGYLTPSMVTLDVTFGRGVFWKKWRPDRLVTMSYPEDEKRKPADIDGNFLALPFRTGSFDAVIYDPPYISKGTSSEVFGDMDAHYGVGSQGRSAIWALMSGGLHECLRVVRPGGRVITKAGRGVDGGKLWRSDDALVRLGEDLGMTVVTQFLMLTRPRPQKHRGPQKSPRSNYSTLTVWDAPTEPVDPPQPELFP